MAFAAVPAVKEIGKPVIRKTSNLTHDRLAQEVPEPYVSWRTQPDLDGAIGAYKEPPFSVDRVQPAAHVFNPGAKSGESGRLEIDIAELDGAGACCAREAAPLPVDSAVADRAFGVVPND
jgi:hypothetical protein